MLTKLPRFINSFNKSLLVLFFSPKIVHPKEAKALKNKAATLKQKTLEALFLLITAVPEKLSGILVSLFQSILHS